MEQVKRLKKMNVIFISLDFVTVSGLFGTCLRNGLSTCVQSIATITFRKLVSAAVFGNVLCIAHVLYVLRQE